MVAIQNLNIRFSELREHCVRFKTKPKSKGKKMKTRLNFGSGERE